LFSPQPDSFCILRPRALCRLRVAKRRLANEQRCIASLDEMNSLRFHPAIDCARRDSSNLGCLLGRGHLNLETADRTPHQRGLATFRVAEHDAFFCLDGHFCRPNNSFPLQAVSRNNQPTQEAGPHASCNCQPFLLESAPLDLAELPARVPIASHTFAELGSP